jgi:methyl-accepting chemotaxis protein
MYQQKQKELAEERERQAQQRREREREKAAKTAAEDHMKREVQQKASNLNSIVDRAGDEISNIPKYLGNAEVAISQAIEKMKKRSFYPFWDCIAEAVENLQNYKAAIERLDNWRADYASKLADYKRFSNSEDGHVIKSFPANAAAVPVLREGSETANRIDQLYDVAHSDFEFSNIYANWRTNKTLVAGFQNLSNGLHAIRGDLENINFTLIDGFDSVTSAVNDGTNQIVGSINDLTATVERQSEEIAANQPRNIAESSGGFANSGKQDEMIRLLKNIQYRREEIPTISDIGYYMETRPKK